MKIQALQRSILVTISIILAPWVIAQPPGPGGELPGQPDGPPRGGFMMGRSPFGGQRKLVQQFDKDGDGRLNREERQAAREFIKKERSEGRERGMGRPGGFGPPGMRPGNREQPKPGVKVSPQDVKNYPEAALYDPSILRTIFFVFENEDWEAELEDFMNTDVEIPATMVVDGKSYPNVGLRFRGMSSLMGVGTGFKRSLNVALDHADPEQRLYGYKTLNLLNSHGDDTFLNAVLYSHIARKHMPAPKVNLVKVVINGENWGVYANAQQFDKIFLQENFNTTKGARWKVTGSPQADGGLRYFGANIEDYKRRFEIKSADNEKSWKSLIQLCKALNETPVEQLEEVLTPILDIDSLLWFLAVDVALINADGYWTRASDYNIYLDAKGKFHIIPHDINEAFRPPMGPGMGGMVFRFGAPTEPVPVFLQEMLKLTDEQRKQVAALNDEVKSAIEQMLTVEQKNQWKQITTSGPGGIGGGPGGPGGGSDGRPGGFPGGPGGRGGPSGGGQPPGQGGPRMRPAQPGEVLPSFFQDQLKLTQEQLKKVAELQKVFDAKLAKILTDEQRTQWKQMREFTPGRGMAGPGGPGGPGGGPGRPGEAPPGGPMGPGGFGNMPRINGVELDPLIGLDDARKPLRSKILAVPKFRTQYLQNIHAIAQNDLNWDQLGPIIAQYRALIEKEVEIDTKKLSTFDAFKAATADRPTRSGPAQGGRPGSMNLRTFADQRRAYLLNHPEVKKAAASHTSDVPTRKGGTK